MGGGGRWRLARIACETSSVSLEGMGVGLGELRV